MFSRRKMVAVPAKTGGMPSPDASAEVRPRPCANYKVQGFCSFVGLMDFERFIRVRGPPDPSARKSHLSLA